MENIATGVGFALYWFILFAGGVLLLLLLTYTIQRILSPRPVKPEEKLEEKTELKEEAIEEVDHELVAGLSAVFAALSRPAETRYREEIIQPPTSLWKISSIMYSSRMWEGG